MRAVVINRSSGRSLGPEALTPSDQEFPIPKNDEVVIQVYAVSVNKLDVFRTKHAYTLKEHWSYIPGLECTGTIVKLGAQVHDWEVGQEVCALLNGGGYAEAVAVPAAQLFPYHRTMSSMLCATCLPQAACLVWESLRAANLSEGKSILVYSRCGVISELTVQIAKRIKATVIVASRGGKWSHKDKPDYIIDSERSDFLKLVLEATRKGVDIVLDSGMSNFVSNANYLKEGGTMVYVDTVDVDVEKEKLKFSHLVSKNATFLSIDRRAWSLAYTADVVKSVRKEVWPYIESGKYTVTIPEFLPLIQSVAGTSEI